MTFINKHGIRLEVGMEVKHMKTGTIIKIAHFQKSSVNTADIWVNPKGKQNRCMIHVDNAILPNQHWVKGELITD